MLNNLISKKAFKGFKKLLLVGLAISAFGSSALGMDVKPPEKTTPQNQRRKYHGVLDVKEPETKILEIGDLKLRIVKNGILAKYSDCTEIEIEEFLILQSKIQKMIDKNLRTFFKSLSPDKLKELGEELFNKLKTENFERQDGILDLTIIGNACMTYLFNNLNKDTGDMFFILNNGLEEDSNKFKIEQIIKSFLINLGMLSISGGKVDLNNFQSCPVV